MKTFLIRNAILFIDFLRFSVVWARLFYPFPPFFLFLSSSGTSCCHLLALFSVVYCSRPGWVPRTGSEGAWWPTLGEEQRISGKSERKNPSRAAFCCAGGGGSEKRSKALAKSFKLKLNLFRECYSAQTDDDDGPRLFALSVWAVVVLDGEWGGVFWENENNPRYNLAKSAKIWALSFGQGRFRNIIKYNEIFFFNSLM